MKPCPFCAEEIQDAAIVCKHCGRELAKAPMSNASSQPPAASALRQPVGSRRGLGLLAIGIGFPLALISPASAGVGMILLWVGLAVTLNGGVIARWGGGLILAIIVGAIGMAMGGSTPSSMSTTNATTAAPAKPQITDAECRKTLKCWGDKHMVTATVRCRGPVERLAKNNFEWTDGFLEPKFSHYRWKNQKSGELTYIGDKIKYQNGFGAWIFHTYHCDMDSTGQIVLDVRAAPGRLSQ